MATLEPLPASHPATAATSPLDGAQATIIIGAGIAGLACARRLYEARQPFLLISENLGGRICRSRDNAVNLGAYYVRANYHHVNQFVQLGRRINTLPIRRHDRDGSYTLWDRRLLRHLPQGARFLTKLLTFRRHYEAFKANCLTMSQAQAITSDPYLSRLYHQPAPEFIRENRIGGIARHYLAPDLHGSTFLRLDQLTAFSLLLGALPAIVPSYEFAFQPEALVEGFSHALLEDRVTAVTALDSGYRVDTYTSDSFTGDFVVVATPVGVSEQLLGLPDVKEPVQAHMFEIAGSLHSRYDGADINLFPDTHSTLAIVRQANGSILFCSRKRRPDFDRYLSSWQVLEHKHWNPAFPLVGDQLLECEQAPNLYLIGDHNICGLEDAYIAGLFAANQIITRIQGASIATQSRPRHTSPAYPRRSTATDSDGRSKPTAVTSPKPANPSSG